MSEWCSCMARHIRPPYSNAGDRRWQTVVVSGTHAPQLIVLTAAVQQWDSNIGISASATWPSLNSKGTREPTSARMHAVQNRKVVIIINN